MVEIISVIISIFLTTFVNKLFNKDKTLLTTSKERLVKAYLPMFRIVEPHIYKDISMDLAKYMSKELSEIVEKEYVFVDPYLTTSIREFSNDLEKEEFRRSAYDSICYQIDTDYEKLKKLLHLPLRGLFYRYYNDQLSTEKHKEVKYYIDFLRKIMAKVFLLMIGLFIFYLLLSLWNFITQAISN